MKRAGTFLLGLAAVVIFAAIGTSDAQAQCFPATAGPPCCSVGPLFFLNNNQFAWNPPAAGCFPVFDVVSGDLDQALLNKTAVNTVNTCMVESMPVLNAVDNTAPAPGQGIWYLVRTSSLPNGMSWNESFPSHIVDRDQVPLQTTCPL